MAFGRCEVAGVVALVQLFVAPIAGCALLAFGVKTRRVTVRCFGLALMLAAIASLFVSLKLLQAKETASKAVGDDVCIALESYNEQIFGSLYLVGVAFAVVRWLLGEM